MTKRSTINMHNPAILTEQAWLIKDLCWQKNFSCNQVENPAGDKIG